MHLQSRMGFKATTLALGIMLSVGIGNAEITFDFEGAAPLDNPIVSGDISQFGTTTEQSHGGGQKSLRYKDDIVEPYENWTYDMPFDITSGTITLWFYDSRGSNAFVSHAQTAAARWGGSIILEDANNPADFGAVEVSELPYGPKYYASEGNGDRGIANDRFDVDSLPLRSVGFHKVKFQITPTETTISVDGLVADEVLAPGGNSTLRLRFMADSPSNGGRGNTTWYDSPAETSRGKMADWLYYDDITITADLPTAQSHHLDFEKNNDEPDYDNAGEFRGPTDFILPHDNVYMNGFVDQWDVVTSSSVAHSGVGAARFANAPAPWKSIAFDLNGASPGTSVTLWFYDTAAQNGDRDKVASVIIEEGANPGNFDAIEITNWPYPDSQVYNYYITEGTSDSGGSAELYSRAFQSRTTGWHKIEIGLYDTYSLFSIDGQLGKYKLTHDADGPIVHGPGLDKAPKLRIMGDSASVAGFNNYTTVDPLNASYLATREPFAYFDDITIPVTTAGVNDWMNY